jgi:hypothetical protein
MLPGEAVLPTPAVSAFALAIASSANHRILVMNAPAIAYVRVSTARQGKSGLGLEAQQAALARFAEAEGYNLIQTFEEVETGKGADALDRRP